MRRFLRQLLSTTAAIAIILNSVGGSFLLFSANASAAEENTDPIIEVPALSPPIIQVGPIGEPSDEEETSEEETSSEEESSDETGTSDNTAEGDDAESGEEAAAAEGDDAASDADDTTDGDDSDADGDDTAGDDTAGDADDTTDGDDSDDTGGDDTAGDADTTDGDDSDADGDDTGGDDAASDADDTTDGDDSDADGDDTGGDDAASDADDTTDGDDSDADGDDTGGDDAASDADDTTDGDDSDADGDDTGGDTTDENGDDDKTTEQDSVVIDLSQENPFGFELEEEFEGADLNVQSSEGVITSSDVPVYSDWGHHYSEYQPCFDAEPSNGGSYIYYPDAIGATLVGTNGNDVIFGTRGNDIIDGRGGDDIICAGPGNDFIWGGSGSDTIYAGSGHDDVFGSFGVLVDGDISEDFFGFSNDTTYGGPGNDTIYAGLGRNDKTIGGDGYDYCEYHENYHDECEYTGKDGALVIEKKTIPASEDYGQEFFFNIKQEGTLAEEFSLYSGDNYAYSPYSIPFWGGRDYTVEEVATPGWRIADIQCVNTDPRMLDAAWNAPIENGVEVKMRRGKVITCKFINELTMDYGDAPDRERRWCKRGEGDNMQTREIEAEGQCETDEVEIPFVEYTELTADSIDADRNYRYKGFRYPTLLKNDGARHKIAYFNGVLSGIFLGGDIMVLL
jgi:hypothetical protein